MWLGCGASLVILLILAVVPSRAAQETMAPLVKVKTTLREALAILYEQQMLVEQRRHSLQQLAERNLDPVILTMRRVITSLCHARKLSSE
jgi:hypothetical protein